MWRRGSGSWVLGLVFGLSACGDASAPPPGASGESNQGVGPCFVPTSGGPKLGPLLPVDPSAGTVLPSGQVLLFEPTGGVPKAFRVDPFTGAAVDVSPPWNILKPRAVTAGGKVVVVDFASPYPSKLSVFDEASMSWSFGNAVSTSGQRALVGLTNGSVAVIGGGGFGPLAAELFNPSTLTISSIAPFPGYGTIVGAPLPNGGIVAMGSGTVAGRYDPMTNTWASLAVPSLYWAPFAAPFAPGKVLFVSPFTSLLYDDAAGIFSTVPGSPSGGAGAASLGTGDVVSLDGDLFTPMVDTHVYDAASNTWYASRPLFAERSDPVVLPLPTGEVFIAGGAPLAYASRSELYVPCGGADVDGDGLGVPIDNCPSQVNPLQTDSDVDGFGDVCDACTSVTSMNMPQGPGWDGVGVTALPDGRVLVTGGMYNYGTPSSMGTSPSARLFDATTNAWSSAPSMAEDRWGHSTTLLADGSVLVVSGHDFGEFGSFPSLTTQSYSPATNTWTSRAAIAVGRSYHTATALPDGRVLVTGGVLEDPFFGNATVHATSFLYDPMLDTWTPTPNLASPRQGHRAVLLPNGKVLVLGGRATYPGGAALATTELFDPATGTFAAGPALSEGRAFPATVWLPDGRLLVAGGSVGLTSDVFDPALGTFTQGPATPATFAGEAAASGCGLVTITSGSTAVSLDPATLTFTATYVPGTGHRSAVALSTGRVMSFGLHYNGYWDDFMAYSLDPCCALLPDADADGQPDSADNCPNAANAGQEDGDADGVGDACDNCPAAANTSQFDSDSDGPGDACDPVCVVLSRGLHGSVLDATLGMNPMDPTVETSNFGVAPTLGAGETGLLSEQTLLRFDLTEVASDALVLSATLALRQQSQTGGGTVLLHPITAPWSEATVTYASFAGAFDAVTVSASDVPAMHGAGSAVSFDLTSLVQAWVAGPNHGLALEQPLDGRVSYVSSEGSIGQRPSLSLCYARP